MEVVLAGLAQSVCVVYLDHILVFSRDLEEHNHNLQTVLERIRLAGLRLKPHIACEQVQYLGHMLCQQMESGPIQRSWKLGSSTPRQRM